MQNKASSRNSIIKKIFLLICASLMLLTATVLLTACGDDKTGTEGLVYSYNDEDSTATVTGYIGNITDVVIPETINGYTVTAIGSKAFYACTGLKSIKISDSIIDIESSAFSSCVSLKEVEIGSSVETIGDYAFSGCTRLLTIEIPNNVKSIGEYAFTNLNLTNVIIGNGVKDIGQSAFYKCESLTSLTSGSGVESIGKNSFYNCSALSELTIPESVVSIGEYAFYGCTALETINFNAEEMEDLASKNYVFYNAGYNGKGIDVNIGENVKSIPAYLFCPYSSDSIKIASVNFTENSKCESIGVSAFSYCRNLITITIPKNIANIGNAAFSYCNKLVEVVNLSDLEIKTESTNNGSVGYYAKTIIKSSDSSKITTINGFQFISIDSENYLLGYVGDCTDLVLPSKINNTETYQIYSYAFYNSNLTSIVIPDFVTSVEENTFCLCKSLAEISLPANLTSLEFGAFQVCSSLKTIVIPDSVIDIGSSVFYNCSGLTSVTIGNGVTSIGDSAFYNCTSLTEINFNAIAMEDLASKNYVFCNVGSKGNGITVNIGENVEKLPAYLFNPYSSSSSEPKITSVVFAEKSVCTSIGENAFSGCSDLTGVYVSNIKSWLQISFGNSYANPLFYAENLYVNGSLLTELEIPNDIDTINAYAFYYCENITSITIGSGVTSIGDFAFYRCTALSEINFNATAMDDLSSNNYVFYNVGQNGDGVTVNIGANVTKIPAYLFGSSSSVKITSVEFAKGSSCSNIGDCAFKYCSYLTSVYVDSIEDWLGISFGDSYANPLYYANNLYVNGSLLTELTISNNIETINAYAFCGCTSVVTITIGSSVKKIESMAFYNCTAITRINFNATQMDDLELSNNAFYNAGQSGNGIIVNIGANVTKIPSYLFNPYSSSTCSPKITSVEFEDNSSCESFGAYAFAYLVSLTSIEIPNTITNIQNYAFYECTGLIEINFNAITMDDLSSNNYVFANAGLDKGGIAVIIGEKVSKIPAYLFNPCSSAEIAPKLVSVTFEKGGVCASIGIKAFEYCSDLIGVYIDSVDTWLQISFASPYANPLYYAGSLYVNGSLLTELKIPNTVTALNPSVFYNNTSITSVVFEDNSCLKTIGSSSFKNCISLKSITIPDSVTVIGSYAFYGCESLLNLTIGNNVTSISDYTCYDCTSLLSITIGSSVTTIGSNAFYNCAALTEINFNAMAMEDLSINKIFDYAGQNGNGITVKIGANVTKIPAYLFCSSSSQGPKIVSVIFESGSLCTCIGNYAFSGCSDLTGVYVDNIETWLGITFGAYCSNPLEYATNLYVLASESTYILLTELTIPDSIKTIKAYSFYNCQNLTKVTIGSEIVSIEEYAFYNNTSLITLAFEYDSSLTSIGIRAFYGCENLLEVTVGDNVKSIGNSAFSGCKNLLDVTIGDNVESIGSYAFYNCTNITSITIGKGVSSIGNYAFYNCIALTEINFNATTMEDLSANNYVFAYVGVNKEGITVNIGSNVTKIPTFLFCPYSSLSTYAPNITSVVFMDGSVCSSIGKYAFYRCSSLISVTFARTSGWKAGTTSLSSSKVEDASTAATYLKSTYYDCTWTRG